MRVERLTERELGITLQELDQGLRRAGWLLCAQRDRFLQHFKREGAWRAGIRPAGGAQRIEAASAVSLQITSQRA